MQYLLDETCQFSFVLKIATAPKYDNVQYDICDLLYVSS